MCILERRHLLILLALCSWDAATDGRFLSLQGVAQIVGGQVTQYLLRAKKGMPGKGKEVRNSNSSGGGGSRSSASVSRSGSLSNSTSADALVSPRSFSLLAGWACVLNLIFKAIVPIVVGDGVDSTRLGLARNLMWAGLLPAVCMMRLSCDARASDD